MFKGLNGSGWLGSSSNIKIATTTTNTAHKSTSPLLTATITTTTPFGISKTATIRFTRTERRMNPSSLPPDVGEIKLIPTKGIFCEDNVLHMRKERVLGRVLTVHVFGMHNWVRRPCEFWGSSLTFYCTFPYFTSKKKRLYSHIYD